MERVLAFDFGASGGRGIIGEYFDGKISLQEIHRFDNDPVILNGTFYWDFLRLFFEVKQGILKARELGKFSSIAMDTWGVDFGFLDKRGDLLQNPVNYRDKRTAGMIDEVCRIVPRDELYAQSGLQFMELNTLFQLYAVVKHQPELLERAETMLLTPDLFGYFLTGNKAAEFSIASTTQMLDQKTKNWNYSLLEKLGIKTSILPKIVKPGTVLGSVKQDICEELGIENVNVISGTGHDTACAVVAIPAEEEDFIFLSSGTWSLLGTELSEPIINEKSTLYNITNEGGYNFSTRFLKNIVGLWHIQETRRQLKKEGRSYTFAEIVADAEISKPFSSFIDPDAPEFLVPGNIPERIREYCKKSSQNIPQTDGEIFRIIYESLALKSKMAFDEICDCTGKKYSKLYIIGGGAQADLMCQMMANVTNCTVMAGPIEASTLGNIAVQLMASGSISDIHEARKVIRNSYTPKEYKPQNINDWKSAYEKFKKVIIK